MYCCSYESINGTHEEMACLVSGLPDSPALDDESLGDSFAFWGSVISSKVVFNASGKPVHGFVQFQNAADASAAVKAANGKLMLNSKL
ncbi:hypothetical protein WJX73_009305 [Symbiochloris irregularis]|uniref:RRM domain-containing protein n=1 Tax=Symbiochloris irregularis TaxID=706552 RepID=A0AAW1PYG0_9CHLO